MKPTSIPREFSKSSDQKGNTLDLKIDRVGASFPKRGQDTKKKQSEGSKRDTVEKLAIREGLAYSKGKAPTNRVYTNDYQKVGRSPDDKDITSNYLGNPLKL